MAEFYWRGVFGCRNSISHEYGNVDPQKPHTFAHEPVYFLSRTVGALLGAFLLARIAEMNYSRVNIVACVLSLLILAFVKNDMVNLICIGAVGFFASSVFSIIYSMALQARPEKANQISGLMITAVAGGGVVTPVIGGVFVTLACVLYLTYCAFGVKALSYG